MKFLHIVSFSLALAFGSPMLSSAQNNTGFFLHTVEKGQSLYSIANMYNVSIEDIVRLNPQCNEQIRAGQALKIPQTVPGNGAKGKAGRGMAGMDSGRWFKKADGRTAGSRR